MDSMMNELRIMLDQCAFEEDFVAAVRHQSPERPNEIMLYEIWRGRRTTTTYRNLTAKDR
jgi:quinol monooxygenase YgiN